ncbi:disintegrin and metalloproteinase domain-containing protein 32-like [Ochotona princeps]|uniref:disintegrin and metalloproteinase domain-containing protein 32-like n=1 Tax=Ochotona princeps TaxID=9978 RepID=UPI00271540AD|nr:disintegrin and metalloproteinase domain-containing protein 32-like [Ochotona princeps]
MFHLLLLLLLLAGLRGSQASGPGSPNSFLQVVSPKEIQTNDSSNSEMKYISYVLPIDEILYTIHLKQRYFVADTFMVYLHNQGYVSSQYSDIQPRCYYQGYIEEHPNSVVTLNLCHGLRGLLQFENVSYGIEPLESTGPVQHLLYKLGNENKDLGSFNYDTISIEKQPRVPDVFPLFLEMYIVVDKALYEYLGSESMLITHKFIEIIGLVNSMFAQFKVTAVLSSLELWSDGNKISTAGEADELLEIFLKWKHSYLKSRPHDVAYLFIYRDYPHYLGAVFPGKICDTQYSAGIVVYPKEITLEAFSVIVTQMLGLSLGISYDDPKKCHCPGAICVMNPEAVTSSGAKIFSSCSLWDFESFISTEGASCLQNMPEMERQRAACGNGRVELSEICDCGTEQQCGPNNCCDHRTCRLKANSQCLSGACCHNCRFRPSGHECRGIKYPACDYAEQCTGASEECPPDRFVMNGYPCRQNTSVCFDGHCISLDDRCSTLFGGGSKNAPSKCYEEIQTQLDRFGNCGKEKNKYKACKYRDLGCGRLVCTYPSPDPYIRENVAIIYAYIQNIKCVSLDYSLQNLDSDPMMIKNGSPCEKNGFCVNGVCVEGRILRFQAEQCERTRCNGNGVCRSDGRCQCHEGSSGDSCENQLQAARSFQKLGLNKGKFSRMGEKHWFPGFYIGLPVLIIATTVIVAVSWNKLYKWPVKEEESPSNG